MIPLAPPLHRDPVASCSLEKAKALTPNQVIWLKLRAFRGVQ